MKNEINLYKIGGLFGLFLFLSNGLMAQRTDELYASADVESVVILEPSFSSSKTNIDFEKHYHYLVARAYFRLLSEAQKAERKLKTQFEQFVSENEKYKRDRSTSFQNKLTQVERKYKAHRAMLSGLKSWNLFSEDRTADMLYFMNENEERIFQMHKRNLSEDKLVKYLIYKLADLYHLEEYQ